MAGTKRMSADEKRKTILEIYHKSKSVYTEKEIVTLATKAGVNSNTVIDVNQSLVDDGLVEKEKIGGSNFFWSFPAKKDYLMQLQHESTLKEIENLKQKVQDESNKLADAKRGREEDDGDEGDGENKRAKMLKRLHEIAVERKKLETEYEVLKENDPQELANLEKELKLVTEAAHRWTDNIFNCKTYLTKKRGMDRKEADKILGITSAFDYPEDKIPK